MLYQELTKTSVVSNRLYFALDPLTTSGLPVTLQPARSDRESVT